MARLDILDAVTRQEFERPPYFLSHQQDHSFTLPNWLQAQLDALDAPVNRIGIVVQWGYFKAAGRFFKTLGITKQTGQTSDLCLKTR